jgi:hypothetical protein
VAALTPGAGYNPGFVRAGRYYTITITWSAGTMLSSLGDTNLLVSGPNAFSQPAQFVRAVSLRGGTIRATYRLSKPTGNWTSADIGTYSILLQPDSASDASANFAGDGILGTFVVATGLTAKSRGGGSGNRHYRRSNDR